ncbi:hypothetical protein MMC30_001702 [Trapelia coarctata]|nr:hypothetical protein [Trapelia coarctata]
MRFLNAATLLFVAAASTCADPIPRDLRFSLLGGQEPGTNQSLVERTPSWDPETGWKTAVARGTRLWNDLCNGKYSDKKTKTLKEDHWEIEELWPNAGVNSWLRPMLLKFAQSTGKPNVQVKAIHRDGVPTGQYLPEELKIRYTNTYCPQGKLIICDNNEKETESGKLPQLFWSDVVFAIWKEQCEKAGLPVSDLDYIFRNNVINTETRGIIEHAYQKFRPGTSTKEEATWLPSGNTEEGFLALLGSPNGYGVARFLLEHETALGRKTVARVVTQDAVNPDNPGFALQEMVWILDEVLPDGAAGGGNKHAGGEPGRHGGRSSPMPKAVGEKGRQSPLAHPRKST